MASYIPQITDDPQSLQTPVLQTDYSFLQQGLQKSNQQYEQGLQKVSADYNAILNTQVVGDQMNEIKKQYIARVQQGLKKVAPTDLSLPKNVSQAENLYAPFWQDETLLYNAGYTKYSQTELVKLNSWKNSKDADVWSRYNPYAEKYIQQGLEDLAKAPVDMAAYSKIQKRQAVPFYDINAEVDDAWIKEVGTGKGIETQISAGGALITQTNGIKSKDAFKTYYLSKVGDRYDEQFKVIASVKAHDARSAILRQNPGLDEKTLNEHLANDVVTQLGDTYRSTAVNYQQQAEFWATKMKDLKDQVTNHQKGHLSPEQEGNMILYYSKWKEAGNAGGQYEDQYWRDYSPVTIDGKPNPNYNKLIDRIATYPEDYIASQEKHQMADIWASGRAAITSEKKELDPVWKEYTDIESKRIDQGLRRQEIMTTQRGQTLDWMQHTGRDLNGSPIPGFDPNRSSGWYGETHNSTGNGIIDSNSGHVLGSNTIDVAHLPSGVDIVKQDIDNQVQQVANEIFNPDTNGLSNIALSQMGLSSNEIIDFSEAAKVMMHNGVPKPEGLAAWNRVKVALKEHGIGYDINGPMAMQTAIVQYSSSTAEQLMKSDKQTDKVTAGKLINGYMRAQGHRDVVLASQRNVDKAIQTALETDPKFARIRITNPDGSKRAITAEDMAHDFPSVQLGNDKGIIVKDLDPVTFADLYRKGKVEILGQNTLRVDGINYAIVGLNGKRNTAFGWDIPAGVQLENELKIKKGSIQEKYGTPEQISKLNKDLSQTALSGMDRYKNGVIAKVYGWDPNASKKGNKAEEQFALSVAPELSLPANTSDFYTYDKDNKSPITISGKEEAAIRSMLSGSDAVKDNISSISYTRNDQNELVARIAFQPASTSSKVSAEGTELNKFAGKVVYLKISPNASGPLMATVPQNSGIYVYSSIYDGATISMDPIIQKTGIDGHVRGYAPGPNGRSTKAAVHMTRRVPDPDHAGRFIDEPVVQATIPLIGPNAKNADEIMAGFYGSVDAHIGKVITNTNLSHSKITGGKTVQQLEQELKNAR